MVKIFIKTKAEVCFSLLLICLCLILSQSSNANAQDSSPCEQSATNGAFADCEAVNVVNVSEEFTQGDTNNYSELSSSDVFQPLLPADLIPSMTNIGTPCTKDCAKTCTVCAFGVCTVEPICYANCQAEAAVCWSLVSGYKSYMSAYVQRGVTYYGLSPQVINALAPYIRSAIGKTRAELEEITVGTSANAGTNNAMTDCDRISWINNSSGSFIVQALRGANKNANDIIVNNGSSHWVYHEFVHTFQCDELGGRTEYAYHWFSSLSQGLKNAILAGNWPSGDAIHAYQPTEQDADSRADIIISKMPIIVPRYVMSIQPLGTQLSGTTIEFVANARNVLDSQPFGSVQFADKGLFRVRSSVADIVTRTAMTLAQPQTYNNIKYRSGDFSADWTIPLTLQGVALEYRFEVLDKNGNLMDSSAWQPLSIIKRYIYVNKNYAGITSNGTKANPYRTIQAALNDPDVSKIVSIRVAAGAYSINSPIAIPVIIESDGSGAFTISATANSLATGDSTLPTLAFAMNVEVDGNGTVLLNPPDGTYTSGTVVQITAIPSDGFIFAGWSGAADGSVNPLTLTIDNNKTLTALFVPATNQPIYLPLIQK